ncbi:uncharacterized protein LOC122392349 isoform X2 [Amphibalanus amphitrite]|uniref:uncharacterized protein LOC122392349 isoform X2 n=1 Tax=Amphibalanus amphitrite TaxID=1232801 RepID=UPI001C909D43|nr:uncharacterized protein LOC122392349 isoform X2 [Amphibalanus amphitrite]
MPDTDIEFMVLWDHFCGANVFSTQGGQWLDALLCYLLCREQQGHQPVSVVPARCVSRLVQGLIYQFQRDVHEACSVQLAGGGALGERPESELGAVLRYMVAGRGWMILHVINALPSASIRISPETVELICSLLAPMANHALLMQDTASSKEKQQNRDKDGEDSRDAEKSDDTKDSSKDCPAAREAQKCESPTGSANLPTESDVRPKTPQKGLPKKSVRSQECRGAESPSRPESRQSSADAQSEGELPDAPADGLYPVPISWETAAVHGTPLCPHTERLLAARRSQSEGSRPPSPAGSSDESDAEGAAALERLHARPALVVSRRPEADCWDYLSVAGAASSDERPPWVAQPRAERPADWTARYRPLLVRRHLPPDAVIRLGLSLLTRCCMRAAPGQADPRCAVCLRTALKLVDTKRARSVVPEHALLLAVATAGPALVTRPDMILPHIETFAAAERAGGDGSLSGRALLVVVRCLTLLAYQSVRNPQEAPGVWPETLALWGKLQVTEALQRYFSEPGAEPELCRALASAIASAVIALKELRAPPPVAGGRRRAPDGCGGGPLSAHHCPKQPAGLSGCPAAFLSEQLLRLAAAPPDRALRAQLIQTAEQSGVCCCLPPAAALPALAAAVESAGSAAGCRLTLRLMEGTLAQLGGAASSVDCRVCDPDRGPADGGRWLPAGTVYARLLTAVHASPGRRRLLGQHLLRVLTTAHPRLRLVLLRDLLLPLLPPADDGCAAGDISQHQEYLITLSVSACRLVLEDTSAADDDPAVAVVRRRLHPAQLTGLLHRPRLRRRALTLLALLAAAETGSGSQTPPPGDSTAALMDTLLAHTGSLSRALLVGDAHPTDSSPAISGALPPSLEADLPQLTDMWQAFVTAISQWKLLGEAVLSRYPDLGRDLASALDRLLRFLGSLERDAGDGETALDLCAAESCCRLLAVLLEAALLVAQLTQQQAQLERRLAAALAALRPRSGALLSRLADLLMDRCQPPPSGSQQSEFCSDAGSVPSSDGESTQSPPGSTDGYDADFEITEGPAPHQSCAHRRLLHVWLLPLLADLLVRSFSLSCRSNLLRCREEDWQSHLRRWRADPTGPDPPRALFQRAPTSAPRPPPPPPPEPTPAQRAQTQQQTEAEVVERTGDGQITATDGPSADCVINSEDSGAKGGEQVTCDAEATTEELGEPSCSAGAAESPAKLEKPADDSAADEGIASDGGEIGDSDPTADSCAEAAETRAMPAERPLTVTEESSGDNGGVQTDPLPRPGLSESAAEQRSSIVDVPFEDCTDRAESVEVSERQLSPLGEGADKLSERISPAHIYDQEVERDTPASMEASADPALPDTAVTCAEDVQSSDPTTSAPQTVNRACSDETAHSTEPTSEPTQSDPELAKEPPAAVPGPSAPVVSVCEPQPESEPKPESEPEPEPQPEPVPAFIREFGRGLRHAASRLAAAARQSETSAAQLRHLALPSQLLSGMPELFSTAVPALEDAVRACADLIWSVHADSVTEDVLGRYLGFLTAPNPPVMPLLWPLPRLFSGAPAPIHSVQFPAGAPVEPADPTVPADGTAGGIADVLKMQRVHRDRRVGSALALSAAAVPLGGPTRPLDPFAGCSVSLWLRPLPSETPAASAPPSPPAAAARSEAKSGAASERSRCHVLSVGAAGQLTELWLQKDRRLLARRTESAALTCRALSEAALSARPAPARWTHLAFRLVPNGEVMTLTVHVDGCVSESVDIPSATCAGSAVLLLGHGGGDAGASYELSSVLVFSEPVLDLEHAFTLRLLGPDCADLTACSFTPLKINISDSLTASVLKKVNISRITTSFGDLIKKMEPALLLSYSTAEPAVALSFPEPGAVPQRRPVLWRSAARHQVTPRLVTAVARLGGLKFFMYLFARVVELGADGPSQATALHVLLAAASHQWRWTCDESEDLLPHMVAAVLGSKQAAVGGHMLQVYLSACIGGVTVHLRAPDVLAGVSLSDPVVRSPSLLVGLFRHWRCWLEPPADHSDFGGRCRLLTEAVRTVVLVLSERYKYRDFNLTVLREKRLLHEVLEFLTSHFVDERGEPLPAPLVDQLLQLLQCLVGTPPCASALTALWRAVLLLHPSRYMFVCQTRSSCYYLLDSALTHSQEPAATERLSLSVDSAGGDAPSGGPPVDLAADLADGKQELVSRFLDSLPPQRSARARTVSPERPPAGARGRSGSVSPSEEADTRAGSVPPSPVPVGETPTGPCSPLLLLARRMRGESEASEESETQSVSDRSSVSGGQMAARLMGLLGPALLALPEQHVPVMWAEVRAQHLCVMANHDEPAVRAAVLKLLRVWCQRAPASALHHFTRDCGFHLLGNQLHSHPATASVLEASRRMVLAAPPGRGPIQQVQAGALTLLLALLPASIGDISVCHNIINYLELIVTGVEHWIGALLDDGLVESVCGAAVRLAHLPLQLTDLGTSQRQILYDDITRLLTSLTKRLVLSTQSKHFQVLYDLLLVLNYLYEEEHRQCGPGSTPTVTVVRLEFDVVEAALSTILDSVNQIVADGDRPRQVVPSRWELSERHRRILLLAVDIITYLDPADVTEHTVRFLEWLLPMVAVCVQTPLAEGRAEPLRQNRPGLKTALGTLLVTLSSPDWPSEVRVLVAVFLAQMDTQVDAVLQASLLNTASKAYQFSLFFHELLHSSDLSSDPASAVESTSGSINSSPDEPPASPVTPGPASASGRPPSWSAPPSDGRSRGLRSAATSGRHGALSVVAEALERNGLPSPPPPPTQKGAQWTVVETTIRLWRQERAERRAEWRKNLVAAEKRAMQCYENHYHRVCEAAHRATEITTCHQNEARRAHLQVLRASAMLQSRVESAWRRVVKQMADQGAPWAPPQAQHSFWELDPTEGYLRQRNRLRKTRLNLAARFFQPAAAKCVESDRLPAPLSYLFSSSAAEVSSQYIEQFHMDRVRYMTPCEVIALDGGVPGEVLISDSNLYFVVDRTASTGSSVAGMVLGSSECGYQRWPCEDIRELHRRRYELRECAVELFMSTGHTHLITFSTTEARERFLTEVFTCPGLQLVECDSLADLTQRWRDGSLTNFEYLMHLNKMAGRTFNDLMQYPVFPFVVRDYRSASLDLSDPAVYRDLRRPMGVQDPTREAYYVERYKYLQSEMFGSPERLGIDGPYHYGTHYSNSGIVLHFLVRMPPFTQLFLKFQDGNFDLPDRTFHSVEQVWRLSSSASNTDFKELIPEFYFLHEMFANSQGFQIGRRQSGQSVDSVVLPDWCQHSARLLVLVLRQALESELVRRELPHWIDLVFGYKQTGPAAVQAVNVFHPATYVGYDIHRCEDAMARQARLTMVRTYGQMPRRLFRSAHPHIPDRTHVNIQLPVKEPALLPTVTGLRWGEYVGSPECSAPAVVWQRPLGAPVRRLRTVPSGAVLALPPNTCSTQLWRETRRHVVTPPPPADQISFANWGQPDGLVRLRQAQKTQPVVAPPPGDKVDLCAFSAGRLWVGLSSGAVHVYDTRPAAAAAGVRLVRLGLRRLAALEPCDSFSVMVAADRGGSMAIWDTNTLELVRRLSVAGAVHSLAVSPTAGDLIVAYGEWDAPAAAASTLELITINGRTAAHRGCPRKVTAVTVSALTEGRAVNVVAAGHEEGTVTLWDTWLLRPVGEPLAPPPAAVGLQVTSLCYSATGHLLYVLHGRSVPVPDQTKPNQVLVLWTSGGVKPTARAARLLDLSTRRPRELPAWSCDISDDE